jgi:hypothetical protein
MLLSDIDKVENGRLLTKDGDDLIFGHTWEEINRVQHKQRTLGKPIDLNKKGDYGADPLGNGKFKMVPSGDIVDYAERCRRLSKDTKDAEDPWYAVRLWLPNGDRQDDMFQAKSDYEAIQKFQNPGRKPPKGTEAELSRVDNGRSGSVTHLRDYTFDADPDFDKKKALYKTAKYNGKYVAIRQYYPDGDMFAITTQSKANLMVIASELTDFCL